MVSLYLNLGLYDGTWMVVNRVCYIYDLSTILFGAMRMFTINSRPILLRCVGARDPWNMWFPW